MNYDPSLSLRTGPSILPSPSLKVVVDGIAGLVNEIAGLDGTVGALCDAPTVVKLSWASQRQTREEDMAYCLLGLLGVNMPLLYGEGTHAFRRLLEEVMKEDSSHDIFLAGYGTGRSSDPEQRISWGLLPESPTLYKGDYRGIKKDRIPGRSSQHFTITNAGLQIELPLIQVSSSGLHLAVLDYIHVGLRKTRIAIPLSPVFEGGVVENSYQRVEDHELVDIEDKLVDMRDFQQVYIRRNPTYLVKNIEYIPNPTTMYLRELFEYGFRVLSMYHFTKCYHDPATATIHYTSESHVSQYVLMTSTRYSGNLIIKLGIPGYEGTLFGKTEATSVLEAFISPRDTVPKYYIIENEMQGPDAKLATVDWTDKVLFSSRALESDGTACQWLRVFYRELSPRTGTITIGATFWYWKSRK